MEVENILKLLKLNAHIEEIEEKLGRAVSPEQLLEELKTKSIDYSDTDTVIRSLSGAFIGSLPFIIDKVVIDESLIPDGVPVEIRKKKYRLNGEVWVVHKSDIDPFPSSPHAHNYDQNLVMHLGNGKMFRKRTYVCTAKRKQFLALRNLIKNIELPPLEP